MQQVEDVLGRPPRDVLPLPITCDLAVEAAEAVKGMRDVLKLDAEAEVTYDKIGAPGKTTKALVSCSWKQVLDIPTSPSSESSVCRGCKG